MADDYPYEVPEGYQRGMSGGSYNPETGKRTSFALPPAPMRVPEDTNGMAGIDWNAVQQNIQNHGVERALAATSAAIQFQGQRGYQQALKNGEPAEKAMAKYGPMMFYRAPQAFGPAQRALRPPVAPPPLPARSASPGSFIYGPGGQVISKVPYRDATEKFDTVREEYEERVIPPDITPGVPEKGKWNPFVANVPAVPAITNQPGYTIPKQTITRQIPRGAGASNAPPATVTQSVTTDTTVTTKEQFDAIPSGTVYTGKDGKKYRKP